MNCYNCGCRLSEKDFCTACGADVSLYKRILSISNKCYNDGLEKAGVRDLSGAIISLKQSLKLNKNHIEARNLLGLVYYEMGEVVSALSEWVISANFRPNKNIANDYIQMIQSNPSRLETINQTIKKYNQTLSYCYQDSLDLAVIQLKKVLSLNPKFVRAHQLLALLYIQEEDWERAKVELNKCMAIDRNNTTTLRYMKEIGAVAPPEENPKGQTKRGSRNKDKDKEDVIKYQSGNETIIQPAHVKDTKGVSSLLNIGIGILIGIAIGYFLIVPARVKTANTDVQNELTTVRDELDLKTVTIEELNQRVTQLQNDNVRLTEELQSYEGSDGTMDVVDVLLTAAKLYIEDADNITAISKQLEQISQETYEGISSKAFKDLYTQLMQNVGPRIAEEYYNAGMEAFQREMYDEAIDNLSKSVEADVASGEALYNLAHSYRRNNEPEKAIETYQKVIELFPNTEKARRSERYIREINDAQ